MTKKRQITRFRVSGYGAFPTDMLRYDQCWPAGSVDATEMMLNRQRRVVELATWSENVPTVGRWESFMWKVVE